MPRVEEYKTDERKALTEAKAVARSHCDAEPVSARMCPFQGMFSCSVIVTLSDGTEVVVQLKDNEIDKSKVVLANAFLGDVVPITHPARTKAGFAYVSRFVPGSVWHRMDLSTEDHVKVAFQVGSLIGRCAMKEDSTGIVDRYVVPRLHKIISKEKMPRQVKTRIESLIPVAEDLKALPLSLCHIDINQMNVILDENANIAGLIDWEQAQLLPVGMNAWCIRYLSVDNRARVDYTLERTQPMADAFWEGLIANLPKDVLGSLDNVVNAMKIGLVQEMFGEAYSPDETTMTMVIPRLDWIEDTFRSKCAL